MFARKSAEAMVAGAADYMAENDTQAQKLMVRRAIKSNRGKISRSDLVRKVGYRIKTKDLNDIIENMVESGELAKKEEKTGGPGRPPVSYILAAGA